jgi:uncharacterized membrane protein YgdD (TMEM256/DUF423 family)
MGALAVALGALGAHYMKQQAALGYITADALTGFETGVRFHLIHTVAMLAIALYSLNNNVKGLHRAFNFFIAGITLFSGSLYFLCTRALLNADWLTVLGPVTPVGGICFIVGWIFIAGAFKKS